MSKITEIAKSSAALLGSIALYSANQHFLGNEELIKSLGTTVASAPVVLPIVKELVGNILPGEIVNFFKQLRKDTSFGYNHDLDKAVNEALKHSIKKAEEDIYANYNLSKGDKKQIRFFVEFIEVSFDQPHINDDQLQDFVNNRALFLANVLDNNEFEEPNLLLTTKEEFFSLFFNSFFSHFNGFFLEQLKTDAKAQTAYFVYLLETSARLGKENHEFLSKLSECAQELENRLDTSIGLLRSIANTQKIILEVLQKGKVDFKLFITDFEAFRKRIADFLEPPITLYIPEGNKNKGQRFNYKERYTTFIGREQETQALWKFFVSEPNRKFKWWIMTGPGGMGKSRLALEFCLEARHNKYNVGFLTNANSDKFDWVKWQPQYPTFIVIDYAITQNNNIIDNILKNLSDRAATSLLMPVRILLLDREVRPEWKQQIEAFPEVENTFYKGDLSEVLQLPDLADELLWQILLQTLEGTVYENSLNKSEILAELKKIDPQKRPLFAFFMGMAIAEGESIRDWNVSKLLKFHLNRIENNIWAKDIRWLPNQWQQEGSKYKNLLTLITLTRGLSREELEQLQAQKHSYLPTHIIPQYLEILSPLTIKEGITIFGGFEPDILGEYFILAHLNTFFESNAPLNSKNQLKGLLQTAWNIDVYSMGTILLLIKSDFESKEKETQAFAYLLTSEPDEHASGNTWYTWAVIHTLLNNVPVDNQDTLNRISHHNLLSLTSKLPNFVSIKVALAMSYVNMIFYALKTSNSNQVQESYTHLKALTERYPDNQEIAYELAKAIVNMVFYAGKASNLNQAQELYTQIQSLTERYPDNQEIALELAQAITNLFVYPGNFSEPNWTQEIYTQIQSLTERYPDNQEIAIGLAKATFNLIIDAVKTSDSNRAQELYVYLRVLAELHPDNQEIAFELAKAIVNLIIEAGKVSDSKRTQELYTHSQILADRYPGNREIALAIATAWMNLITSDLTRTHEVYPQLQILAERYPDGQEVSLALAKAIFNLIIDAENASNLNQAQELYSQMQPLAELHPDNQEIAIGLAKATFNLIIDAINASDSMQTQKLYIQIQTLAARHPDNHEIALEFIRATFKIINDAGKASDSNRAQELFAYIQPLTDHYPDNQEIALEIAKVIVNMVIYAGSASDLKQTKELYDQLQAIVKRYPDNQKIALELARAIGNMINAAGKTSDSKQTKDLYDQLQAIVKCYADNQEIALVVVKVTVYLIFKAGETSNSKQAQKLYTHLQALVKRYPNNQEVAVEVAKAMFTLIFEAWKASNLKQAQKLYIYLQALAERYSDNQKIALESAKATSTLIFYAGKASNLKQAQKLYTHIEAMVKRYPNNQEIALELAKAITNMITYAENASNSNRIQKLYTQLQALAKRYPDSQETALAIAKAMVNMIFYTGNSKQAQEIYTQIQTLAERYPDNQEIAHELAKATNNLIKVAGRASDLNQSQDTYTRLQALAERYPDNQEIAHELAKATYNICHQSFTLNNLKVTNDFLKKLIWLTTQYSTHIEIQKLFLTLLQNSQNKDLQLHWVPITLLKIIAGYLQLSQVNEAVEYSMHLNELFSENSTREDIAAIMAQSNFLILIHAREKEHKQIETQMIQKIKSIFQIFPNNAVLQAIINDI